MAKKSEGKGILISNLIVYSLFIIGALVGIFYFDYFLWPGVGLFIGLILGDLIVYKKFGYGKTSDQLLDLGLFFALLIGFGLIYILLFILMLAVFPYIAEAMITKGDEIWTIAFLIIGAITFPIVRYFRTRKQKAK